MKKRLYIISTIYLAIIIALSFCWQYLPFSNSQKGDDIIKCVGLIGILDLVYSLVSKMVVGKAFLIITAVIMPFVSFTAALLILLVGNAVFRGFSDYLNLQLYFYFNAISAIAYVFLVSKYSLKHNPG